MKILVLNSGSSSQKTCLYEIGENLPDDPPACLWEGKIEWDGEDAAARIKNSRGVALEVRAKVSSRAQAVEHLLDALWSGEARVLASASEVAVVGHRIVHGGPHYEEPVLITPEVKSAIAAASEFAPLHAAAELEGMDIVERLLGAVPQVAVFDTGFHRNMPLSAAVRRVLSGRWRVGHGRLEAARDGFSTTVDRFDVSFLNLLLENGIRRRDFFWAWHYEPDQKVVQEQDE